MPEKSAGKLYLRQLCVDGGGHKGAKHQSSQVNCVERASKREYVSETKLISKTLGPCWGKLANVCIVRHGKCI